MKTNYKSTVAEPMVLQPMVLQPNSWCNGQEWIDSGGDWEEFIKAHKIDDTAEYIFRKASYGVSISSEKVKNLDYDLSYTLSKWRYRIKLDSEGKLPTQGE